MNPQELIYKTGHGKDILRCIQCGTCSGSCPFTDQMDYAPRGLFALIKDGEMEEVLKSNTMWFCSSCYQCVDRCPQEIPVTDIMYDLKQIALKLKTIPSKNKMPDLYSSFAENMRYFGRVSDPFIMAKYSVKHPLDAIKSIPLAVRLFFRKRMEIKPQSTKNRQTIENLLSRTKSKENKF